MQRGFFSSRNITTERFVQNKKQCCRQVCTVQATTHCRHICSDRFDPSADRTAHRFDQFRKQ